MQMEKGKTMPESSEIKEYKEKALENFTARFDEVNEKSLAILEDFLAGGYKKMLENLRLYITDEGCRTNPEVIADAAFVLKKSGFFGKTMAEDVIKELSNQELTQFNCHSDQFFKKNPILTVNVENLYFVFNDIKYLGNQEIQKVLSVVDRNLLARALKKSDIVVKEKFITNLTRQAADELQLEIDFLGQIKLCDIEKAQVEITKIIRQLEKDGKIVICKDRDEEE